VVWHNGAYLELVPLKVRYIQYGEEIEQWALPNKQWWLDFEQKWEHTTIIEFIEVSLTADQLARYEQIKYFQDGWTNFYTDYILEGKFPEPVIIDGKEVTFEGCPLWGLVE
jgi:hypothetical protein